MPTPRRKRPRVSTSTAAACLATSAVWRWGRITMPVTSSSFWVPMLRSLLRIVSVDVDHHFRIRLAFGDDCYDATTPHYCADWRGGDVDFEKFARCKFSVNLRHFFSAGMRHGLGHCLRDGQSRSRRERGCLQPWHGVRSSSVVSRLMWKLDSASGSPGR